MTHTRKNNFGTGQPTVAKETTTTVLAALYYTVRLNNALHFGIFNKGLLACLGMRPLFLWRSIGLQSILVSAKLGSPVSNIPNCLAALNSTRVFTYICCTQTNQPANNSFKIDFIFLFSGICKEVWGLGSGGRGKGRGKGKKGIGAILPVWLFSGVIFLLEIDFSNWFEEYTGYLPFLLSLK